MDLFVVPTIFVRPSLWTCLIRGARGATTQVVGLGVTAPSDRKNGLQNQITEAFGWTGLPTILIPPDSRSGPMAKSFHPNDLRSMGIRDRQRRHAPRGKMDMPTADRFESRRECLLDPRVVVFESCNLRHVAAVYLKYYNEGTARIYSFGEDARGLARPSNGPGRQFFCRPVLGALTTPICSI